jgi:hypothetical protein
MGESNQRAPTGFSGGTKGSEEAPPRARRISLEREGQDFAKNGTILLARGGTFLDEGSPSHTFLPPESWQVLVGWTAPFLVLSPGLGCRIARCPVGNPSLVSLPAAPSLAPSCPFEYPFRRLSGWPMLDLPARLHPATSAIPVGRIPHFTSWQIRDTRVRPHRPCGICLICGSRGFAALTI